MEKKRFIFKIPKNYYKMDNYPNNNKTRLIKKIGLNKIKNKITNQINLKKSNTPNNDKNKKVKLTTSLKTPSDYNKTNTHNKIFCKNISFFNYSNNNSLRNKNDTNILIRNYNSHSNCKNNINEYDKNDYKMKYTNNTYDISNNKYNNKYRSMDIDEVIIEDNNYTDNKPLKMEINSDVNRKNNNMNNNLEIILDIINSNKINTANNSLHLNEQPNNNNIGNIFNEKKIINSKILYRHLDGKIKYSKTDFSNCINPNPYNNNNKNHNSVKSEINNYNIKNTNESTLKELVNKKIMKTEIDHFPKKNFLGVKNSSINNIFVNSNTENNNNNTNENIREHNSDINTSYTLNSNNKRLVSENQKQNQSKEKEKRKEKGILKTHENSRKVKYQFYRLNSHKIKSLNIGDYNLKKKIKNSLDQLKKNKELSLQLENTSKQLDKLQHMREKYISVIYDNIDMQKKFNILERKNENNLKEIESQYKKLVEKDNIIDNLTNEIKMKSNYIHQKEEQMEEVLNQKEERIDRLNNTIQELQDKLYQLQKENRILYKFKDLYNENATKNIQLENNMNLFNDINNKYISLQKKYDELKNSNIQLNEIKNKYNTLIKEYPILKDTEKKYKDIYSKYNDLEENFNLLKDIKNHYDSLLLENKNLNEIKKKYEKIIPEYLDLKQIREKYGNILKEQKNLLLIENKYNDLIQETQELRVIQNKYDKLIEEKNKENKEHFDKINKIKSELNGVIRENIIIKNELEVKNKEINELIKSKKNV